MTKMIVNSGGCGYNVIIAVDEDKAGKKRYTLAVETECKHVNLLAKDLPTLNMADALTGIPANPVYQAAARTLKHAACPIPSAILKTLEVEAGLNVPKDVTMVFMRRG
jgi:hypothetical protein